MQCHYDRRDTARAKAGARIHALDRTLGVVQVRLRMRTDVAA